MKTDILFGYIKLRAKKEGVEFQLTEEFFEHNFENGIRNFFGINVDDDGIPFHDEQEPKDHPGLLESHINNYEI
jgi:hypothetical protein